GHSGAFVRHPAGRDLFDTIFGQKSESDTAPGGNCDRPRERSSKPAQSPTALEFEVASSELRPDAPGAMTVTFRHGTLNVDLARLRQIIGLAYSIQRVRAGRAGLARHGTGRYRREGGEPGCQLG